MKKILTVVGTRPNIIKITQFHKIASRFPDIDLKLIHTGQHYNQNMSDIFFTELGLKQPDYFLQLSGTTVVSQFAQILTGLENTIAEYKPDALLVVGDVNSTLAASLVANKMGVKLVHVESGLRSLDRSMPEEINRLLTDEITDLYFITEESGRKNLLKEGKDPEKIFFVGNTMIDTLVAYDKEIRNSDILKRIGVTAQKYALMTMHRPGNVDSREGLLQLLDIIKELTRDLQVVFPIHPRTRNRFKEYNLSDQIASNKNLILLEPAGYLDFQNLILNSLFVITDSGGIQEETTFRKVPCLTLRPNTERPSTIEYGSNTLLGFEKAKIFEKVAEIKEGKYKKCEIPPMWDGHATERIFEILAGKI